MKKLLLLAGLAAILAGCKSITVERYAQKLATYTDTNGVVRAVLDGKGKPVILDGGWSTDYWQHWNWQQFDTLSATAGQGVSLTLNGYHSGVDSNLVALVDVSFKGAAELAAKVGAAIATAGGSVAGEAAYNALRSTIAKFVSKGGNASTATVTCTGGNCTITDGTITETCTNCMDVATP